MFGAGLQIRGITPVGQAAAGPGRLSVRGFTANLNDLGRALRELRLAGKHSSTGLIGRAAAAQSAEALGLGGDPTAATLRSSAELNRATTSYSTSEPSWDGLSTAAPQLDGVYNGSIGDTTLTFTAFLGGEVSTDPLTFSITDGSGQVVETLQVTPGQGHRVHTLSTGLGLRFDPGLVVTGDSFTVDVSASVGTSVNVNGAFNGLGENSARFEPGVVVSAGSFLINGHEISVAASDSITSVLNRINNSSANVTASFDSENERVVFTHDETGESPRILLTQDTSGLVAALKLDAGLFERGSENGSKRLIRSVPELSGITSGEFSINGRTYAIDVNTESLSDINRRLYRDGFGVVAYYDERTDRFRIRASGNGSLILDDGTSGFFSGLGVTDGLYRGEKTGEQVTFRSSASLQRELRDVVDSLESVLKGDVGGYGVGIARVIKDSLIGALEETFATFVEKEGDGLLRSGLGLNLGAKSNGARALNIDSSSLQIGLKRRGAEVRDLLYSNRRADGRAGLIERLEGALQKAYDQLEGVLSPEEAIGLRLDVNGRESRSGEDRHQLGRHRERDRARLVRVFRHRPALHGPGLPVWRGERRESVSRGNGQMSSGATWSTCDGVATPRDTTNSERSGQRVCCATDAVNRRS